jgi:hypothetical protein
MGMRTLWMGLLIMACGPRALPVTAAPQPPADAAPVDAGSPDAGYDMRIGWGRDEKAIVIDGWLEIDLAGHHARLVENGWDVWLRRVDPGPIPDSSWMSRVGRRLVWQGGADRHAVCIAEAFDAVPACYQADADPRAAWRLVEAQVRRFLSGRRIYWMLDRGQGLVCEEWEVHPVADESVRYGGREFAWLRRMDADRTEWSYSVYGRWNMLTINGPVSWTLEERREADELAKQGILTGHGSGCLTTGPVDSPAAGMLEVFGERWYLDEEDCLSALPTAQVNRRGQGAGPCG